MADRIRIAEEPEQLLPVRLAVRPVRVVTLVPELSDVAWERAFEVAIATQTGVWGGRTNLVLPYDATTRKSELFWALMRAYDPDVVVQQQWIIEDAASLAPSWLRRWKAERREWATQNEVDPDEAVREGLNSDLLFSDSLPADDVALCDAIVERVGPLDLQAGTPIATVASSAAASWPATRPPVGSGLGHSKVRAAGDIRNTALRLLVTAELGRLTADSRSLATEADVEIEEISGPEWLTCRHITRRSWDRPAWGLADVGVADYRRAAAASPERAAVVVGNTAWDFAFHYALRRMGVTTWYVSSRLRRTRHYMPAIVDACIRERGRHGIAVVSVSSPTFAKKVARELVAAKYGPGGSGPIDFTPWWEVIPEAPVRTFEEGMEGWLEAHLALRDGRTVRVPTPLSRTQEETGDRRFSWMVDVASEEWSAIAHPELASRLSAPGGLTNQARAGRDGLSFFSHRIFRAARQSPQSELYRPHLLPKSLYDQTRDVLVAGGWQCHLSEKGAFSEAVAQMFGGTSELIEALQDEKLRLLLRCYRAPRERSKTKRFPGAWLTDGSRRVLTAGEIFAVIGSVQRGYLDELVDARLLERGVALKCDRCRQASWYPLRDLDEAVPCRRCASRIKFLEARSLGDDALQWRYKLAESAYHFAANNGVEPVLAVAALAKDRSRDPVQVCHELLVQQPGTSKTFEVDLFVSFGSELWIGEANSTGRFDQKQPGRLVRLARALNTNKVVFATSAPAINERSLTMIEATFRRPRFELRTLTGLPGLK